MAPQSVKNRSYFYTIFRHNQVIEPHVWGKGKKTRKNGPKQKLLSTFSSTKSPYIVTLVLISIGVPLLVIPG